MLFQSMVIVLLVPASEPWLANASPPFRFGSPASGPIGLAKPRSRNDIALWLSHIGCDTSQRTPRLSVSFWVILKSSCAKYARYWLRTFATLMRVIDPEAGVPSRNDAHELPWVDGLDCVLSLWVKPASKANAPFRLEPPPR